MSEVWFVARPRSGLAALALGLLSSTAALALQSGGAAPTQRSQAKSSNVTDTYYWTSASHLTDTFTRFTAMPATYGIALNYRYN